MKIWATREQIDGALAVTNGQWRNNVTYNRAPEPNGKGYRTTITVVDSKGLGAVHTGRRRVKAACFHVHETFIRALFALGATRVKSTLLDVRGIGELEAGIERLAHQYGIEDKCLCKGR